jgi:hypothetical protein
MDELLKKLLAAEILTEDTKNEFVAEFNKQLEEAISIAQSTTQATVTAQLNEQWITEREMLIEALDTKVTEALTLEMAELHEDINRFRDLEIEYAHKLVEAKGEMSETLKGDIAQLIEKMDAFFEIRLTSELAELREDFAVVRQNEFGRNIFEAFISEFKKHYAGDDSVESKLNETELRLDDALTALEESERKTAKLQRKIKLEKVLTPLSGRTREVMEAILKNVDTALIEDAYQTYVGRVLKETNETQPSEKETKVLAEGQNRKQTVTGKSKSGNDEERILRETVIDANDRHVSGISSADLDRIRKVAGL